MVEVLLGVSVFSLLVTVFVGAYIYGRESSLLAGHRGRAALVAEEAMEGVRSIRDGSFVDLTAGDHGVLPIGGQWQFFGTSVLNDIFTQQVTINDVSPTAKSAVAQATWTQNLQRPGSVSLSTRLTDWRRTVRRGGMLIYGDYSGNDDVIQYRLFSRAGTWGAVQTVPDFGVPLHRPTRRVELYSNPSSRDEKVLVTKHFGGGAGDDLYLYAQVWNGTTWGNATQLATRKDTNFPSSREFDGDYLDDGRFLLVYGDDTRIPKFRFWDGTAWSSAAPTVDIRGRPVWIVVRSRSGTNEAMVVILDDQRDTNTIYWNGSSWLGPVEHGNNGPGAEFDMVNFVWRPTNPTLGALVYNEGNDNHPNIKVWDNGIWGPSVENINLGKSIRAMQTTSDPTSGDWLLGVKDNGDRINSLLSDTTPSWHTLTNGQLAVKTDNGPQRSFSLAFETNAGQRAIAVYADGPNADALGIPKYRTYDPATKTWGAAGNLADLGGRAAALESVGLIPDPGGEDIMTLMATTNQQLWTVRWNGATHAFYSTGDEAQIRQATNGSSDEDFWFDYAWDN
ncbi:MAG: hypothetical protein HYY50_00225 [Candidatus Kerfeldbacteria bacterium]|nr:hypothetical protein [Candidatus Kerfeldbacteria bacterium]